MKIAIIGIRGIPACYGGFETFAEELAPRLVNKGHNITVYGRSHVIKYNEKTYKGVNLVLLPTIQHKYLDTIIHTFNSLIHSIFCDYDIIFVCNAANSPLCFIPRLFGKKVVINVDGIERKRAKWNIFGKLWYRLGEYCSTIFANVVVSDAIVIKKYYLETYKKDSVFIPYGAYTEKVETKEFLNQFGLNPNEYILYVSRLEPENNAHLVIKAFEKVKTNKKLVIVGDAPYSSDYIKILKSTRDPRIIFTGYVFGQGYKEFQSNAFCYIHATSVGGTHPALIEGMGYGNCVIVNGTPENIEVVGDAAIIFDENSEEALYKKLDYVINGNCPIDEYKKKAHEKIKENYSWNSIAEKYESLFLSLNK